MRGDLQAGQAVLLAPALPAEGKQIAARGCWWQRFCLASHGPQGAETELGSQPGNELKTI